MNRLAGFFLFSLLATVAWGCGDDAGPSADASVASDGGGNQSPVAAFTMTPTCTSSSSTLVVFTSTSSDPDGDTLTCAWTFNSGTPGSSAECTSPGISFPNVAPYPVTLVVSDGNGGTDTATLMIGPC